VVDRRHRRVVDLVGQRLGAVVLEARGVGDLMTLIVFAVDR